MDQWTSGTDQVPTQWGNIGGAVSLVSPTQKKRKQLRLPHWACRWTSSGELK